MSIQQQLRIPSTNTATTRTTATVSKGFFGNKFPFPVVVMNAQSNEDISNSNSDEIPPDNQEEEGENNSSNNNNNNNNSSTENDNNNDCACTPTYGKEN